MLRRRPSQGFNIAFLDIMSCGLGAVILIFILIKHNIDNGSIEAEILLNQLESLQTEQKHLQNELDNISKLNADEERLGDELLKKQVALKRSLADISNKTAQQQKSNKNLKSASDALREKFAESIIENQANTYEQYFLGLNVEGKRIAILLDRSGSMVDGQIRNIMSYRVASSSEIQAAPKWRRAKKAAQWLLNRVPGNSQLVVLGFSEQAEFIGDQSWYGTNDRSAIGKVSSELAMLSPQGPTNLHAAFDLLDSVSPPPTDIYLVTDGLPTKGHAGDYSRGCKQANNISSQCRKVLLDKAIASSSALRSAKFNVILLPLEGDPEASARYWQQTSVRNGLLLSPAASWP